MGEVVRKSRAPAGIRTRTTLQKQGRDASRASQIFFNNEL